MKHIRTKMLCILLCLSAAFCLLSGCGRQDVNESAELDNPAASSALNDDVPSAVPDVPSGSAEEQTAALYIGNQTAGFTEYPLIYTDELTPNMLIQGIADLTGWDLSLADEITSGKGGITVLFGPDAFLFTGPPEVQKDEFHVYDVLGLTFMALDSIQKTLQNWANPVTPESVDIYFAASGDVPMELTELGVTWPLELPYSHGELEALLMQK